VTLVHPDGVHHVLEYAMRINSTAELVWTLTEAGLMAEGACGALDGRELTLRSNRLALLARK
jgi:hypothetical protein